MEQSIVSCLTVSLYIHILENKNHGDLSTLEGKLINRMA